MCTSTLSFVSCPLNIYVHTNSLACVHAHTTDKTMSVFLMMLRGCSTHTLTDTHVRVACGRLTLCRLHDSNRTHKRTRFVLNPSASHVNLGTHMLYEQTCNESVNHAHRHGMSSNRTNFNRQIKQNRPITSSGVRGRRVLHMWDRSKTCTYSPLRVANSSALKHGTFWYILPSRYETVD